MDLKPTHFIDKIIAEDVANGLEKVVTRFPPEPNGLLHIGSAYAINISYSMAKKYNGKFNLRFDDTNPVKEDIYYVNAIVEDMDWLGVDYGGQPLYGSDYFDQMYEYAVYLIKKGKAYVCDLSQDEIREYRGTLTEPGGKVLTATVRWKKTSGCLSRCGKASSRKGRKCCEPRSTWRTPILS